MEGHYWPVWLLVLFGLVWVIRGEAYRYQSFYFLVVAILYAYLGLSSAFIKLLWRDDISAAYLITVYLLASAVGMGFLLMRLNKKWKHARI